VAGCSLVPQSTQPTPGGGDADAPAASGFSADAAAIAHVLGRPIEYHPIFYTHLLLLHLSLILRVGGDILLWLPGRYWGGLFNAIAIILFLVVTVVSFALHAWPWIKPPSST
jgi:hypothetical protein